MIEWTNGDDMTYRFPSHYEVCERCEGEGHHSNPAIDGNGITASEWSDWDDDEREAYFTGRYDVLCEECHGARVVPVIDRDKADPAELAEYDAWVEAEREYRAECRAEARAFGY